MINININNNEKRFRDLHLDEIFEYDDMLCIKVDDIEIDRNSIVLFSLENKQAVGKDKYISPDFYVRIPKNFELEMTNIFTESSFMRQQADTEIFYRNLSTGSINDRRFSSLTCGDIFIDCYGAIRMKTATIATDSVLFNSVLLGKTNKGSKQKEALSFCKFYKKYDFVLPVAPDITINIEF